MAKLRLNIAKKEIIIKKIISVTIDNIQFDKKDYMINSKVIQYFYNFIHRNINNITFISYTNSWDDFVYHIYLKENKIHNENDEAFYRIYNGCRKFDRIESNYFINGERMSHYNWLKISRKIKLDKLRNT